MEMNTSTLRRCLASIAMVCLLSTPVFGEVLQPHYPACYERVDLEFLVKYWRPGIIRLREGRCFMSEGEAEVAVLRYVDVDLPIKKLALVQPKAGGLSIWISADAVAPVPLRTGR